MRFSETGTNWILINQSALSMRFHIFKSSPAKNLIILSSQTRHLYFPNFNILSLPGGKTRDIIPFIPTAEEYIYIIVLLIGGNDLFEGNVPFTSSPKEVAEEIKLAVDRLTLVANKVFVIGIPHRHNQLERTKAVNKILSNFKVNWSLRDISHNIYAEYHLEKDEVHLSEFGLSGLKSILKNKVLYKLYKAEVDEAGHQSVIKCSKICRCGRFNP